MSEMSKPYSINISVDVEMDVEEERLLKAAYHALEAGGQDEPCALTVRLADDEAMRKLNRQFAGIDAVTDVLSFPAEDEPYAVEPDEPLYLGDVVIAVPVARSQAAESGRSLLAELQTLAIHGTLHLLGFDHHTSEGQAEMQACEAAAMKALYGGNLW